MSLDIEEKVRLIFNPNPSAPEYRREYLIQEIPGEGNSDATSSIAHGSILAPTQEQANDYPLIFYNNSHESSSINQVILPLATDRYEIKGVLASAEELEVKLKSDNMPVPKDLSLYHIVKDAEVHFIGTSPDKLSGKALCYSHPNSQPAKPADRFGANFSEAGGIPVPSWISKDQRRAGSLATLVNDTSYKYVLIRKDLAQKDAAADAGCSKGS